MPSEPYGQAEALGYIRTAWAAGRVTVSGHAYDQMAERDLSMIDVENIVRLGNVVRQAEFERGSWRYAVETSRLRAIFAFAGSADDMVVVTAMRKP